MKSLRKNVMTNCPKCGTISSMTFEHYVSMGVLRHFMKKLLPFHRYNELSEKKFFRKIRTECGGTYMCLACNILRENEKLSMFKDIQAESGVVVKQLESSPKTELSAGTGGNQPSDTCDCPCHDGKHPKSETSCRCNK